MLFTRGFYFKIRFGTVVFYTHENNVKFYEKLDFYFQILDKKILIWESHPNELKNEKYIRVCND